MTRPTVDGLGDDPAGRPPDDESAREDGAPQDDETPKATPPASILGAIHAEIAEELADETKLYPVGKVSRLRCRYRALDDDVRQRLQSEAAAAAKLRKKVRRDKEADSELEQKTHGGALLLVNACVEMLWLTDEGVERPVHELFAEAMGDDGPTGPLRYDRGSLELLMPGRAARLRDRLGRDPNSLEVCREMHRIGKGENYQALRSTAAVLEVWMSGVTSEVIEDIVEGN